MDTAIAVRLFQLFWKLQKFDDRLKVKCVDRLMKISEQIHYPRHTNWLDFDEPGYQWGYVGHGLILEKRKDGRIINCYHEGCLIPCPPCDPKDPRFGARFIAGEDSNVVNIPSRRFYWMEIEYPAFASAVDRYRDNIIRNDRSWFNLHLYCREEKYEYFTQRYPLLTGRMCDRDLADYLNLTLPDLWLAREAIEKGLFKYDLHKGARCIEQQLIPSQNKTL